MLLLIKQNDQFFRNLECGELGRGFIRMRPCTEGYKIHKILEECIAFSLGFAIIRAVGRFHRYFYP